MFATLLVHLELGQSNSGRLRLAVDLAERLDAGVIGVALCQPLRIIYNDGYIAQDLIDQDRQTVDEEMAAAESEFRAACGSGTRAIGWRPVVTYLPLAAQLAREARCADLLIIGPNRNSATFNASRHIDAGDLIMQAGRPCLIVPATVEKLPLEHVVVGWKDTGESRRAAYDALPLLKKARRVTVVEVAAEADLADARARLLDVVGWLERHAIEATPLAMPATGDDSGRLKAVMQEQAADLFVAGAYGHSQVREWVPGGVTRDLLLRPGQPTIVSH